MRVDLDAKVRARDGEELGSVWRAVVDPRRNEITHLVVGTGGLLGREVLVPAAEIERARPDGAAVRLGLTPDQVERLAPYVPAEYVTPAPDWTFPGAYAFGAYGGFVWPIAAAPGAEAAEAAGDRSMTVSERPTIAKGALVLARDGEDVGVVDEVRLDAATGELLGFVLRIGGALRTLLGGGDAIQVGREEVARVEEGAVHLRRAREEIERRAP